MTTLAERHAAAVARITGAPPAPCWLCGDMLQCVADLAFDEWAWADQDGHRSAVDADLRCLEPWGGASGRLKWLGDGQDLLRRLKRTRKGEKTWPDAEVEGWYWLLAMEYTSLKMRAEGVLATTHVHQPARQPWTCDARELAMSYARPRPGVVYHCDVPAWLRPSGWYCRECKILLTDETASFEHPEPLSRQTRALVAAIRIADAERA